ncbi:MAG: hypothetical protein ACI9YT_000945 [Halobacteriales archaeon]
MGVEQVVDVLRLVEVGRGDGDGVCAVEDPPDGFVGELAVRGQLIVERTTRLDDQEDVRGDVSGQRCTHARGDPDPHGHVAKEAHAERPAVDDPVQSTAARRALSAVFNST